MMGSTSWMIPGTYFENAKRLEGMVDFVELLVYEWNRKTKRMLFEEMPRLLELDLFYTVHLPFSSMRDAKKAYYFFEDAKFPILNYVLHPMKGWKTLGNQEKVALENLKEKVILHERMVFDVGHHLLGRRFPFEYVENIVEVHLMGVKNGTDHIALDEKTAKIALPFVKKDTLVNFEVFSMEELKASMAVWKDVTSVE